MAQTENLTVMFTDIVGYSELTSRQSREQNRAMLRDHNRLLLPLVVRFGGRRVKSIGDSLMLGFSSPTDAVRCGMAMHDALAEYNFRKPENQQIHIRVALNVGEVRVDGSDIFGEAVNVAARVEGLTPPDQIYLTEAVYLAMNKAEVPCTFAGKHKLKGIPEPVKLFSVPPRQVNRLVPGGEELGEAPGELPFGGMHRAPPTVSGLAALMSVMRNIEPTTWREFMVAIPPSARLIPLLTVLLAALMIVWWRQHHPAEAPATVVAASEAPAVKPLDAVVVAPSDQPPPMPPEEIEARDWLQRGHAAFERNRRRDAAPAYGRALELLPALQNDKQLATRLVACLSWASDLAIPIIRKYPSPAVVDALAKRTGQTRDRGAQRAADLLNELGFVSRIDPYYVAVDELEKAGTCDAKRTAISRIRAMHDVRTLPALRAALGNGIGGWFKSSCYRSEAKEAIAEIERSAPRASGSN